MQKLFKINILLILFLYGSISHALPVVSQNPLYDVHPWSAAFYHGQTVEEPLTRILQGDMRRWPEQINTVELAYTLNPENPIRRFFYPIVGVVQLAGNVTTRYGANQNKPIYEFDPYLIFRFSSFPWNHYIDTSLAIGEGASYVTAIPSLEQKDNVSTKHLLNFLMFEATFAHPSYRQWQLLTRIHHRSGAFGLYNADNSGSNDVSIGIRYLFD